MEEVKQAYRCQTCQPRHSSILLGIRVQRSCFERGHCTIHQEWGSLSHITLTIRTSRSMHGGGEVLTSISRIWGCEAQVVHVEGSDGEIDAHKDGLAVGIYNSPFTSAESSGRPSRSRGIRGVQSNPCERHDSRSQLAGKARSISLIQQ